MTPLSESSRQHQSFFSMADHCGDVRAGKLLDIGFLTQTSVKEKFGFIL
jgi:hypothetical protein